MTIVENPTITVPGGVDTHLELHVAAAVDANGGVLGGETFDTTTGGYRRLVAWLAGFGEIGLVGVEGTGSYGAGLARHLAGKGIRVVEVDHPNRQARHRAGKTDAVDAIAAARAALTGTASGVPKSRTGNIEAIRVLMVARRSAVHDVAHLVHDRDPPLTSAPDDIRARFIDLSPVRLAKTAAALKPRRTSGDIVRYTASGFVCEFSGARVVRTAISTPSRVVIGRGEAVSHETGVDEFTRFVRVNEPRLRQALVAARGTEAGRDAACDALAYGWEHWDRVGVLDNPVGYLYRVGLRSRQVYDRRSRLFDGDAARIPDVEPKLVDSVNRLPQRQRTVVVLVHCFEWSLGEVAEVTGLAKSTVQNHLERGMRSLRTALGVDR